MCVIAAKDRYSKWNLAASRAPNLQSPQVFSVPRRRGMVQLGQHILHIWPLPRVDEPTALNNLPQPLCKTKVLRRLRFPRSVTLHDRVYHSASVCEIPVRDISTKNLTACGSNYCEGRDGRIRTNLVHNHPESVAVRLFCRPVIGNSKPIWIE